MAEDLGNGIVSKLRIILPPDAPEVLDFYARRSPIFMAASFDADAAKARGQDIGDGTPVHLTIPTANPWVPLRILGLGKTPGAKIQADVYLLTDDQPALLPAPSSDGELSLQYSQPASDGLLAEKYYDDDALASSWWSYNAWAAGSAMEAIGEQVLADRPAP